MSWPALTAKQRRFIEEYVKTGNATQAALTAGYSPRSACRTGSENLQKPYIKAAIEAHYQKLEDESIATATEVLQYLTSVVRGESSGEELVVEGIGDGLSEARIVKKGPSETDKLKAAKMLAKRFSLEVSKSEEKARADRLSLENEKLRLEIERLKGGSDDDTDDGFLEALNGAAAEAWSDE